MPYPLRAGLGQCCCCCRSAGNALGCLGLFYASTESGLDYVNDGRYPDLLNSLGAGTRPAAPCPCIAMLVDALAMSLQHDACNGVDVSEF